VPAKDQSVGAGARQLHLNEVVCIGPPSTRAGSGHRALVILLRNGRSEQVFTIQDGLSSVGTRSPFDGTGSFNATLTHHQRKFFGRCLTYAATVQGNVVLNF
jgi:hypothetical protein